MQAVFLLDKTRSPQAQQGQLIKMAREGAGLTQRQLGEKVGLSQRRISQIECGDGTSSVLIFRIARALGQKPELFDV